MGWEGGRVLEEGLGQNENKGGHVCLFAFPTVRAL